MRKTVIKEVLHHPEKLGRKVGFEDLTPMYGKMWQRNAAEVVEEMIEISAKLRCGLIYCEENGDKGFFTGSD